MKHRLTVRVGTAETGMAGMNWFKCDCGKSGRSHDSAEGAAAEYEEHVRRARQVVELKVVVTEEQAQQVAARLQRQGHRVAIGRTWVED